MATTNRASSPIRLFAFGLIAFLIPLLGAVAPASADPAVPTDFRSDITAVDPALPEGFELRVLGGDSFLELRVPRGSTAIVRDYGSEPDRDVYLSFEADGTVRRNERSTAASLNETRFGTSASAEIGGDPVWKVVARDGSYAWHDHRIHWMSPTDPPMVGSTRQVDLSHPDGTGDWWLPIEMDGEEVAVRGELLLLDSPSPIGWYALIAASIAVVVGAAAVAPGSRAVFVRRVVAGALVGVGLLASAAGFAQWRDIPADAGGTPVTALVPALGLIAAVAALGAAILGRFRIELPALAATVAALGGWAVWRRDVLTHAVLPTPVPGLDRVATALALGVAVGVAITLVWKPPGPASKGTARPRKPHTAT